MDFITAKEKAIKYIGISKKTEYEVRNKLIRIGAEDVIEEVTQYIKELGYIDDVAYCKSYVNTCEKEAKKSINEIKIKLLQKGVKEYIIDTELSRLEESDYEGNIINRLENGKYLGKEEELNKYLCSRGFRGYTESEMYL